MITLEELRANLSLPPGEDHKLSLYRDMVIELWETMTGLLWNARTAYKEVIRLRTDPRPYNVFLSLVPVTSITLVEEREIESTTTNSWTTLDTADYELLDRRTIEKFSGRWTSLVRVTYNGGSTEADAAIRKALIIQAQFLDKRLAEEKITIRSQNFEGGSGVLEDAFIHPFFKQLAEQKANTVFN